MAKTKKQPIKAVLGFTKITPTDLLARANSVYTGFTGDTTDYPNPSVDMASLKSQIDAYSVSVTAALDGGKKAIAARQHLGEALIKTLRLLGHYAEANCKDDMTTFLKSGFQAVTKPAVKPAPLSQFIRKIDQGANSGELLVTISAVKKANAYELRWAALATGTGAPGPWTTQPVGKTRPAVPISGLTAGTTYAFQVRSLTNSVYSDWSDSVTRMVT